MRPDMNPSSFDRVAPPEDRPMPTRWSEGSRRDGETILDIETAVTLNCVVGRIFDTAASWSELLKDLGRTGFVLQFDGPRLVLVNEHTGQGLCTCAALGHSFRTLLARLGKPSVLADSGRLVARPGR